MTKGTKRKRKRTKLIPYYVSYFFGDKNGPSGFGACEISTSHPISGMGDLELLKVKIKEQFPNIAELVILSWQKFE